MAEALTRAADLIAAALVGIVEETSPEELLAHLADPTIDDARLASARADIEVLARAVMVLRRRAECDCL